MGPKHSSDQGVSFPCFTVYSYKRSLVEQGREHRPRSVAPSAVYVCSLQGSVRLHLCVVKPQVHEPRSTVC